MRPPLSDGRLPAAQYLRMSTDHQRHSIEAQRTAISAYADAAGYEVVRSYADRGISGVRLDRREGLQALLRDVLGGAADYKVVLTYDVSRWGRFQDPDESAHYEFLCRQAGVRIEYVAETFASDDSLPAVLMKHLKRGMAAEYSRELSVKVARAKRGLASQGHWVGGPASFGLRRMARSPDGKRLQLMEAGEQKALQGFRTTLVPGPAEEIAVVRRIFRLRLAYGKSDVEIASLLNDEGVAGPKGGAWTKSRIKGILRDEKYAGVYVYGVTHQDLRGRRKGTVRSRLERAWAPIISLRTFRAAQTSGRRRKGWVSDAALLEELRVVLAGSGTLSADVIAQHPAAHSPAVFKARFGGLVNAYRLVGYEPSAHQTRAAAAAARDKPHRSRAARPQMPLPILVERLRALLARTGRIGLDLIDADPDLPAGTTVSQRFGGMAVVYAAAGYAPTRQQAALAVPRRKSCRSSPR